MLNIYFILTLNQGQTGLYKGRYLIVKQKSKSTTKKKLHNMDLPRVYTRQMPAEHSCSRSTITTLAKGWSIYATADYNKNTLKHNFVNKVLYSFNLPQQKNLQATGRSHPSRRKNDFQIVYREQLLDSSEKQWGSF